MPRMLTEGGGGEICAAPRAMLGEDGFFLFFFSFFLNPLRRTISRLSLAFFEANKNVYKELWMMTRLID